jgi:hypothetical protein
MNHAWIALTGAAAMMFASVGCNAPVRTTDTLARKQASLPKSWVYVSGSSRKVSALPKGLQVRLADLRTDLVREQQGQYFAFYGKYTAETQSRIDAMNRACTEAYFVSDIAMASDLTPEVKSVSETEADLWWSDQVLYDIQARELQDDWRSFWLLDSPSILSRYPIVDTSLP